TCFMRRLTMRWLPVLLTLLIALSFERTGRAAPIPYTTSGTVGATAGVPIGNFDFVPASGTLLLPGAFSLGRFSARPLQDGASLTFHDMPYYIDVTITSPASTGSGSPDVTSGLMIQGLLNGTVTGTSSSDVLATVTSVTSIGAAPLPFPLDSFHVL